MGRKTYKKRDIENNLNANISADSVKLNQYNPSWIQEYKMMREELVNYMNKIQELRNMTYVAVVAVFAISLSNDIPFICILLPLLFILPTYANATNYWLCVRKASAYLVVFHESYKDCPFHWESRHNMLKKMYNKKKESFSKSVTSNILSQLFSYYAFAAVVVLFYFVRLWKYWVRNKASGIWNIKIDGISIGIYILLGIAIMVILCALFICLSRGRSYDEFLKYFLLIKEKEEQMEIGKCWIDGKGREEEYTDEIKNISGMLNKYL